MSFDQFVQDRGSRLLRSAWLLTGDKQHAEDLVQTALVKCFSRYNGEDDRFEGYVRKAIHRTYISWWRRSSWHEKPVEQVRDQILSGGDVERRLDLARALRSLSRPQRAAVTLRYFDDLTIPEVAKTLGIPEGTAKTHIHRGLAALKQLVDIQEG